MSSNAIRDLNVLRESSGDLRLWQSCFHEEGSIAFYSYSMKSWSGDSFQAQGFCSEEKNGGRPYNLLLGKIYHRAVKTLLISLRSCLCMVSLWWFFVPLLFTDLYSRNEGAFTPKPLGWPFIGFMHRKEFTPRKTLRFRCGNCAVSRFLGEKMSSHVKQKWLNLMMWKIYCI